MSWRSGSESHLQRLGVEGLVTIGPWTYLLRGVFPKQDVVLRLSNSLILSVAPSCEGRERSYMSAEARALYLYPSTRSLISTARTSNCQGSQAHVCGTYYLCPGHTLGPSAIIQRAVPGGLFVVDIEFMRQIGPRYVSLLAPGQGSLRLHEHRRYPEVAPGSLTQALHTSDSPGSHCS